ncbi:MAG: TPM domain-containing protein [Alphaproteobacteria bacterium]
MVTTLFSPAERARIEVAIKAAESGTSAEFVCVAARASESYLFAPVLFSAVAALAFPVLPWLAGADVPHMAVVQVLVFVLLVAALSPRAIAARLAGKAQCDRAARRLAREAFFNLGLAHTRDRTGVLLFASLAEHHVEVIADEAIHALAKDEAWQGVVERFTAALKQGRVADGYAAALGELDTILSRLAPRRPDDVNEIKDRLIEIA